MAGAIKHMERSRRSHRKNANIYASFHRNAIKVSEARVPKMTFGQKFASMINPLKQAMKRATGGN